MIERMYQKATTFATFAFRDSNELTSYLKTPRIQPSEKFDSVTWWFENKKDFPVLSRIAKDYLSIMPTSIPSERTFSQSGLTVTKSRSSLHSETVRELVCLKSWNKLFQQYF